MELPFPLFPILLIFSIFLILVMRIGRKSKANALKSRLPPGPWKLPVIGNVHQLFGKMPHQALRDLANKYGPLMYLQLGELPTVVVSSPEIAKEIMKTHDVIFASRPATATLAAKILSYDCSDIICSPYGSYWRQLRKICALELLSAKRVQQFRSIREKEVLNFIDGIKSETGSSVNLTDKLGFLSCRIVARAAFGVKCKHEAKFMSNLEGIVRLTGGFNLVDLFPSIKLLENLSGLRTELEKLHEEDEKILAEIIEEHKKKRQEMRITGNVDTEDLVDVLLKEQEESDPESPLSDRTIKAVIFDMFSAGTETSATTVEWTMAEMMKNPKVMEKAQLEVRKVFRQKGSIDEEGIPNLHYLKAVIKEALRLHPPAALLIPRECGESCEINGYEIPAKTRVLVNAWAIGRNPRYWNDAEKFKPERFLDSSIDYKGNNFEYIPFGAGRRICPGMLFGLATVELQLAMLLYHFNWKLPDGMNHDDFDMTEAFGITVRRKEDLILVPVPYN